MAFITRLKSDFSILAYFAALSLPRPGLLEIKQTKLFSDPNDEKHYLCMTETILANFLRKTRAIAPALTTV